MGEKTVLVIAQVMGYMLSKVIGVKVIAEMAPKRRAAGILILIAIAEGALLLFTIAPSPLHVLCLFLNGLPLGMVFGLVLGFLEGRRHTEALTAGLCASFILADGFTKSVGTWLLDSGVSERLMPALAGGLFVPPLLLFVWMLTRIPPPSIEDVAQRTERTPMDGPRRMAFLMRYGLGLAGLIGSFFLITLVRSVRADFAPEIWKGLGLKAVPSTFANSEILVALGVTLVNGLSILIIDNRRAFFTSIALSIGGVLLMVAALLGLQAGVLGPFPFMVAIGTGLYIPYVAMHTTILERLIAMTRDRGNIGFLMYVADSVGYLGYVVLMLGKGYMPAKIDFVAFFSTLCWVVSILATSSLVVGWIYFANRSTAKDVTTDGDWAHASDPV